MLTKFIPAGRVAFYHACHHKNRIDLIGQRLIDLQYQPVVIGQHVHEWLRFCAYVQKRGVALPLDSRSSIARAYLNQRQRTITSASRTRVIRASLRFFLEANGNGIFDQRVRSIRRPVPAWMANALDQYRDFQRAHRGLATQTLFRRSWQLSRFAEFLEQRGVRSLEAITPLHIQQFALKVRMQALETRKTYAVTLRSFFRWAYSIGIISKDLRQAVAAPRKYKQQGIRDVLSEHEVTRILAAVDRSTIIGRRDYAILILAARYGLRPCDIRLLQLESIQWRKGILAFKQSKTGRLLTLPLLPDVADALIAYIRDGRPTTGHRYVFIRHKAPYEPFAQMTNFSTIIRQALARVGMDQRTGRRCLYLFRHTLASRMLAAKCSMKHIGDVLGHTSTESTREYTSIDLTALRSVMLSEKEVRA